MHIQTITIAWRQGKKIASRFSDLNPMMKVFVLSVKTREIIPTVHAFPRVEGVYNTTPFSVYHLLGCSNIGGVERILRVLIVVVVFLRKMTAL